MFLKNPTQNHLDHKPSIKKLKARVLSVTVTVVLLDVCLSAFAPGRWSSSLTGCGCVSKRPSIPSYVPYLCGRSPPQWLDWEKEPCLCHFSMHRSKRKIMAFSINMPHSDLPWVRSVYPEGSSMAGDLWRWVRLTVMAIASAASSPKKTVMIFFLWRCSEEELGAVAVQLWPPSASCS